MSNPPTPKKPVFPAIHRIKPCRHGLMLYNIHDTYIGRSLDLYGEWSLDEIKVLGQIIKPGQTVVEIGSNIGAHTVFLAQAVGPAGRVLAFEPQRILFQMLCANLAMNSIPNVDARQLAVGKAPGKSTVPTFDYYHQGNFGGTRLGNEPGGEAVSIITIDSLNLSQCHLMKLDIEDMEKDALEGAARTIARCQPILYVECNPSEVAEALIRHINSLGYNMFWHRVPCFDEGNFFSNPKNVFGRVQSHNMLCIPKTAPRLVHNLPPVLVPAKATRPQKQQSTAVVVRRRRPPTTGAPAKSIN